ncbi:MAG: calcium-translocating P-type ATPase, PMCA-type [Oscillospiraceae bacterium]|nr:calcium-translocating P-type ATPase, PMCA-type [Oscillospiraceae bacterium]
MRFYCEDKDTVLLEVGSSDTGLSSEEVAERLNANGKNKLAEPEKDSLLKRFFKAMADPMIFLLLGAAAISTATTIYNNVTHHDQPESFADLFIIVFVLILNTVLSLVQESKSEQAIEALMEMTAATSRVYRDGKIVTVKSEDLVVGDVVALEAGDAVPADCRILESHSMKVDEASLTGESIPVNKIIDLLMLKEGSKDVPLGDRFNMVYSGSVVVYGRGRAVVVAAGMDTEMGKIADALAQAQQEETPLQKKLGQLSVTLTKMCVYICAFVFLFGVIRDIAFSAQSASIFDIVLNTFIIAVALAVAAIPEGLPAVTTIILSIGVTAMSKRNALIRRLTAVETLGCAQVICSDKTGTLTQNRMTVVDSVTDDPKLLAKAMALCSDAARSMDMSEADGEPTECALVNHAFDMGLVKSELDKSYPRIGEAPFDSTRKLMSTIHNEDGRFYQYTKGACEILLDRCAEYLDNGEKRPMTGAYRDSVLEQTKDFSDRALRVLAAAYRVRDAMPDSLEPDFLECDMVFIGFLGMIDPCRPEVYAAIKECREAGIRPVMITGDHKDTAFAIAREIGIITDASQAIEGEQLDDISDEELVNEVKKYSVYARVQPKHKTRIVTAWKANSMVTAMTGDGVNDAASIKSADIGIGMGITGTAVTKGASDMVLADDNFATIIHAVEEGRKVYDNIRKVIQFQLTTNLAEIVAVFFASILGFRLLSAAHLLWINLVTDSTPGLALGMEKAEDGIMKRKPRSMDEGLFDGGVGLFMIIQGVFMGLLILFSYFFGYRIEYGHWRFTFDEANTVGMTMAFTTTCFVEMFRAFTTRSLTGSIFTLKNHNWWLWGAFACTFVLTCGVIYIPMLSKLFGLDPVNLEEMLVALGLAITVIPVSEISKVIHSRYRKE